MALYFVPGRGLVDDQQESVPEYGEMTMPDGTTLSWGTKGVEQVPTYQNPAQYGDLRYQWLPGQMGERDIPYEQAAPGYLPELLQLRERVRTGQASDWDKEWYQQQLASAQAIPTRDIAGLQAGWGEGAERWNYLNTASPDLGPIMLSLLDKMEQGTATSHEQALFQEVRRQAEEQNYRASVPQESDRFNPLSNEFMLALGALGGAAGGAGAFGAFAPLGAAGAGGAAAGAAPSLLGIPTSTLGTIGAIGSYGGTGAGLLGAVTGQPWLQKLGLGLGVVGGLAGGLAGLGNVFSGGIQNIGDVARLAGSAGRITGALGRATGVGPLQQAGRYLGLGSQVGRLGGGVAGLLGAAQGVQEGAAQALSPQDLVTQRGGDMEFDYSWDYGGGTPYDNWSWDAGAPVVGDYSAPIGPGLGWDAGGYPTGGGLSLEDQVRQAIAGRPDLYGSASTPPGWLGSVLGGLGGFLAKNPGLVGAGVSALGSLGSGLIGANAAGNASAAQAAALQRGLDLQTAQWLQTQANQAPWLEAGRQALPQLQQLAAQGQGAPFQGPGLRFSREDYDRFLPSRTPGWTPSTYAGYTPTETPSAAGYRYTPGQVPGAANYRYTPGAVPTLSGQELLANDPGVQFRLDRARNALEGSAAARGSLLSGTTLAALQEQGQDLASQEYGNAWQRAAQQAQMREQWGQAASQLGFGQAMSEAQLREQLAQQAGAQNWQQALQEAQQRAQQAQFGWQAGFQGQQQAQREAQAYDTDAYNRALQQNQLWYSRDIAENQTQYERALQAWNSQRLLQGEQWNRLAGLAGYGPQAAGQLGQLGAGYAGQMGNLYGQLGTAQGMQSLGPALSWQGALSGGTNAVTGLLASLNR